MVYRAIKSRQKYISIFASSEERRGAGVKGIGVGARDKSERPCKYSCAPAGSGGYMHFATSSPPRAHSIFIVGIGRIIQNTQEHGFSRKPSAPNRGLGISFRGFRSTGSRRVARVNAPRFCRVGHTLVNLFDGY